MVQGGILEILEKDFKAILGEGGLWPFDAKFTLSEILHIKVLSQTLATANEELMDLCKSHVDELGAASGDKKILIHPGLPALVDESGELSNLLASVARTGLFRTGMGDGILEAARNLVKAVKECDPAKNHTLIQEKDEKVKKIRQETFESVGKILKARLSDVLSDPEVHKKPNLGRKLLGIVWHPSWTSKLSSFARSGTHRTKTGSGHGTGNTSVVPPTLSVEVPELSRDWPNFTNFGDQSASVLNPASLTNQGPSLSPRSSRESVHSMTQ